VPIFLGQGIRLFEGMDPAIQPRTTRVVGGSPGVTHLRLDVVR
jgi:hypothetical protein